MKRSRAGGAGVTFLVGLIVASMTPSAWAKADYRLQDRFFFAAYSGVALSSAQQITATTSEAAHTAQQQKSIGPLFGLEASFWPCDYAGVGLSTEVFTMPSPSENLTATTADLGMLLVLAVPLRYVQPYGGVWGGLRISWLAGQNSGVLFKAHPLAGLNFYVNRNVRVFLQWQYIPLDYEARGENAYVSYTAASTHLLGAGIRWSPDFFHAARPAMKFDLIWWSALLTIAGWGLGNWFGMSK